MSIRKFKKKRKNQWKEDAIRFKNKIVKSNNLRVHVFGDFQDSVCGPNGGNFDNTKII